MLTRLLTLAISVLFIAAPAYALPQDWQMGFQEAASPSAERIHEFHNTMLWLIFAIALFVLALLLWVIARYNAKANPVPQQFSHNVMIEVLWTIVPVLILIFIMIKSFPLLYYTDRTANPEMTLKVTGYQWYWGYEYPDNEGVSFTSYMIPEKDIDTSKGQVRLLSVDNPVVLPVDTNIQILTTGADVIHAFAVPALGIKLDAMPGRTNETWVRIDKPGIYYGQCSELCGKDHSFMPIEVHAVSKEEFASWIQQQKSGGGAAPKQATAPVSPGGTASVPVEDQPKSKVRSPSAKLPVNPEDMKAKKEKQ